MVNLNIITLGASGAGKTVFLASLFKTLSLPSEEGIYLEVHDYKQQTELNHIYTEIVNQKSWPRATRRSVSSWCFSCLVKTKQLDAFQVCKFTYLDYGGGILTDTTDDDDEASYNYSFREEIPKADAVIVLIDGSKLLKYIQTEYDLSDPGIAKWLFNELPSTIQLANRCRTSPLHFVITKWDLLEGKVDLSTVRQCLDSKCKEFSDLSKQRIRANVPIRIIPISSIGKEFVTIESDGSMTKNLGIVPEPIDMDIPLSYVLIDKVVGLYQIANSSNGSVNERTDHNLASLFNLVPDLVNRLKLPPLNEPLRKLNDVGDEKNALSYAFEVFAGKISEFEQRYPESVLGGDMKLPTTLDGISSELNTSEMEKIACSLNQFHKLIAKFECWLDANSFQHQRIEDEDSPDFMIIQITKKGAWRKYTGLGQALNITLSHRMDNLYIGFSSGSWVSRLAPVGVVAVLELPLSPFIGIAAGYGAWQQSKIPKQVLDFITIELTNV